jgi:hypothetical protein
VAGFMLESLACFGRTFSALSPMGKPPLAFSIDKMENGNTALCRSCGRAVPPTWDNCIRALAAGIRTVSDPAKAETLGGATRRGIVVAFDARQSVLVLIVARVGGRTRGPLLRSMAALRR